MQSDMSTAKKKNYYFRVIIHYYFWADEWNSFDDNAKTEIWWWNLINSNWKKIFVTQILIEVNVTSIHKSLQELMFRRRQSEIVFEYGNEIVSSKIVFHRVFHSSMYIYTFKLINVIKSLRLLHNNWKVLSNHCRIHLVPLIKRVLLMVKVVT